MVFLVCNASARFPASSWPCAQQQQGANQSSLGMSTNGCSISCCLLLWAMQPLFSRASQFSLQDRHSTFAALRTPFWKKRGRDEAENRSRTSQNTIQPVGSEEEVQCRLAARAVNVWSVYTYDSERWSDCYSSFVHFEWLMKKERQ